MVLLRKIKRGRRSILWKYNGEAEYIDGPKLVVACPCINRLERLILYQATDMQYLEIQYNDGRTVIQPGPTSIFSDPLKIDSIMTKDMIKLDANELLITYTQVEQLGNEGEGKLNVKMIVNYWIELQRIKFLFQSILLQIVAL